ncbi:MAG TPA: hypothetical protein VH186_38540 [Chloroflexia bacterium]|nr:hypothetical protein [Chloroflexia bacterium]
MGKINRGKIFLVALVLGIASLLTVLIALTTPQTSAATVGQAAKTSTITSTTSPSDTPVVTTTIPADTTAPPAKCDFKKDLSGSISGTTGTVTNSSASCSYPVGMASYKKYNNDVGDQTLYNAATATIGPKQTIQLSVSIPDCAAQVDLFYGEVLSSLSGQRYGERLLSVVHVNDQTLCTVNPPTTEVPTTVAPTTEVPTTIAPTTSTPTTPPVTTPGTTTPVVTTPVVTTPPVNTPATTTPAVTTPPNRAEPDTTTPPTTTVPVSTTEPTTIAPTTPASTTPVEVLPTTVAGEEQGPSTQTPPATVEAIEQVPQMPSTGDGATVNRANSFPLALLTVLAITTLCGASIMILISRRNRA